MDDESEPLPLKTTPLTDGLKERLANRPDQWTLAWWKSQFDEVLKAYRGASYAINLAVANTRDHGAILRKYEQRIEDVEAENRLMRARLGEIQAEQVAIQERIDKMAAWATKHGRKESEK